MLRLSFAFLVIAIITGVLGFARMGSSAMFFPRIMIVVFSFLAIITFGVGKLQGR